MANLAGTARITSWTVMPRPVLWKALAAAPRASRLAPQAATMEGEEAWQVFGDQAHARSVANKPVSRSPKPPHLRGVPARAQISVECPSVTTSWVPLQRIVTWPSALASSATECSVGLSEGLSILQFVNVERSRCVSCVFGVNTALGYPHTIPGFTARCQSASASTTTGSERSLIFSRMMESLPAML